MKSSIIITIAAAMMLCACSTSRKVSKDPAAVTTPANKQQTTVTNTTPQAPATAQTPSAATYPAGVNHFVSDLDVSISMNGDRHNLGGKLSAIRDQLVRINLTYMGFIEVAILEFTPQDILLVNRIGKEYTRVKYNDMDVLVKNNVTFKAVQDMAVQKFYAAQDKKIVDESLDKAIESMLNGRSSTKKVSVSIEVGKPDTNKTVEPKTTVKSSYKEVPAQVLVNQLSNIAK